MREAAAILKGHTVHPDVRVMVVPATQEVYKNVSKKVSLISLSMQAVHSIHRAAVHVWVVIWVLWLRVRNVYLPQTVTLSEEWEM